MTVRAVLTYHSIDESGSPVSVAPAAFTRHLAWLTSGRVVVSRLDALAAAPATDDDPRPRVAITFDDGFVNFASWAWPRLRDAGLPATVFLVSGHMGGTNVWGGRPVRGIPALPLMSWSDAAACAAEGAEIGAHSRTHPHLPELAVATAREEMDGGRQDLCNRLGVPVTSFAYPYGAVSPGVVAAAAAIFEIACTTEHRELAAGDTRHRLPRLDMFYFQAPDALRDWGSAAFRRRVTARRTLRALRHGLTAWSVRGGRRTAKGL